VTTSGPVISPFIRSLSTGASVLVLLALASSLTRVGAQSTAPAPAERRFEVASVKPNALTAQAAASRGAPPPATGIRSYPGGRWTAARVTARTLLLTAFDINEWQLVPGPAWLTTDRFDINATAGGEATAAEYRAMLRSLLAERFGLKTHMETRQMPLQVLTLARPDGRLGPALKPTSAECAATVAERRRNNTPEPTVGPPPATPEEMRAVLKATRCGATTAVRFFGEGVSVASGGTPLSAIVDRVAADMKSAVVDRTGLTGLFDFLIEYETTAPGPPIAPPRLQDPAPYPPLAKALERQLGLKLETEIGPLSMLVVDAIAQPTPD
jgi:uncharacterized protein (TIGR03435 family)